MMCVRNSSGWRRRCVAGAVLIALVLGSASTAIGTAAVCTADDLIAADQGCPDFGPCTLSQSHTIASGCEIDFGTRQVTIAPGATIDIGSGTVTFFAGSLTINGDGAILGIGDGEAPDDFGGFLEILTTGDVILENPGGTSPSRIDLSGETSGGNLDIEAGGQVSIAGIVDVGSLSNEGDAGRINILADGDISSTQDSEISAVSGREAFFSGAFNFDSLGDIALGSLVDGNGGDSGAPFTLLADGNITIAGYAGSGLGEAGNGGGLTADAGLGIQIMGDVHVDGSGSSFGFGGDGGGITLDALDFIQIDADLSADGGPPDGFGGDLSFFSGGDITGLAGCRLSASCDGVECGGGTLTLDALSSIDNGCALDVSGGEDGGRMALIASKDVSINGACSARGKRIGSVGGMIAITAGRTFPGADSFSFGNLIVGADLDAGAGGCNQDLGCASAGSVALTGCDVVVAAAADVLARANEAGNIGITARNQLTVDGSVDARTTGGPDAEDGMVTLLFPTGIPPSIGGSIMPAPMSVPLPACVEGEEDNCLVPCLCEENCDDPTPTPTATTTPTLPLASTATPTATATASASHTPTATQTMTATATMTPTPLPGIAGDCDRDTETNITELQLCINVFLDTASVDLCPACEVGPPPGVDIVDLQGVINCFLDSESAGCPAV